MGFYNAVVWAFLIGFVLLLCLVSMETIYWVFSGKFFYSLPDVMQRGVIVIELSTFGLGSVSKV